MTDNRSALKIRKDVIAMIEQHTPGRWTMDKCPDAHGFSTIRPSDGSINGDTDAQPIATVYRPDHALLIATAPETAAERDRLRAVNAELVTALRNMTALANNMRETIEGGNFATRYEIPYGYFNAAYVAMEQAESLTRT